MVRMFLLDNVWIDLMITVFQKSFTVINKFVQ